MTKSERIAKKADEFDAGFSTIKNAFEIAGIETRSPGGGSREPSVAEILATEHGDELRRPYNQELLSGNQIAERFGRSPKTIYRALDHLGVELMPVAERIAASHDLKDLYVDKHLSTYKIADRLGVNKGTAATAISLSDIESRPVGYQIQNPTVNPPLDAGEVPTLRACSTGKDT